MRNSTIATRFMAYINSDQPGAAYVFAGTIMGGTFAGIVTFAVAVTTALSLL